MLSPMEAINLICLEVVTMLSLSLTLNPHPTPHPLKLTFVTKLSSKEYMNYNQPKNNIYRSRLLVTLIIGKNWHLSLIYKL